MGMHVGIRDRGDACDKRISVKPEGFNDRVHRHGPKGVGGACILSGFTHYPHQHHLTGT